MTYTNGYPIVDCYMEWTSLNKQREVPFKCKCPHCSAMIEGLLIRGPVEEGYEGFTTWDLACDFCGLTTKLVRTNGVLSGWGYADKTGPQITGVRFEDIQFK